MKGAAASLCVKCFLNMQKPFKCHMCRRLYDFKKKSSFETIMVLDISAEDNPLKTIILNHFPGEQCSCYKVNINNEVLHYIILYTQQIEDYEIRNIISDHVTYHYPDMQRDIESSYLFTMNVNFYLQDFYDIILKRVLRA